MDPVTAALNLATQALKVYETFLTTLNPQQKEQYAKQVLDAIEQWNKFGASIAALVSK